MTHVKLSISLFVLVCCGTSYAGEFRRKIFANDPCFTDQFKCLNNVCINRYQYCNGIDDCGDNSDERYCNGNYQCPTEYPFYRCSYYNNKCIPLAWKCDGIRDCNNGEDEADCPTSSSLSASTVSFARRRAVQWIRNQAKTKISADRWGLQVPKTSVALYLADPEFASPANFTQREIAYELSIRLLSKFALRRLKDVPTSDLASYTNALLVTCLDPRNFQQVDLVKELRSRVDAQNYTSPYHLLTLCNAGDKITKEDTEKLIQAFWNARREFWTDTQAIAVMALACAGNQDGSSFNLSKIHQFTDVLKLKQYRNGTVDNLQTTALVMQALFSSEPEDDENTFDEEKAFAYILREQKTDGSFGNMINTYYVLPVLSHRSLMNISSVHCAPEITDEETALDDLVNQVGPKVRVRYSLWIGNERDVEKTLKLRVAANTSFYGIMEIAQTIDPQYRFQYVVKNGKPYVNAMFGIQDDPESGRFWFSYFANDTKESPLTTSPADFIPEQNDHMVMWYRRGSWIE